MTDSGSDDSDAEEGGEEGRTCGHNKLSVRLKAAHAGNLACIKLIGPEDPMEAGGDQHDKAAIGINYVMFGGRKVTLPPDFRLAR
ncbi:hypothetical protein WJX72_010292 [[Myrmecia] bisecta]|uniref:Uncharacterized protein n=1 Tax=[Myrmecia] bisecta TaxID=41462 RepID=A0AAW1R872_9CHLO